MTRFIASGFRAVTADSPSEAAEVFAARGAKTRFGRAGYCFRVNLGLRSRDGRSITFDAQICANRRQPGSGRMAYRENVQITVTEVAGA